MQYSFDAIVSHYLDYIIENITHGSLLVSVEQIAKIRNRSEGTVRNEISDRKCPIPTFLDGGRRVASAMGCAIYLAQKDFQKAVIPPAPSPKKRGRIPKVEKIETRMAGGAK